MKGLCQQMRCLVYLHYLDDRSKIYLHSSIDSIDTVSKLQSQDRIFVLLKDFIFALLCSPAAWTGWSFRLANWWCEDTAHSIRHNRDKALSLELHPSFTSYIHSHPASACGPTRCWSSSPAIARPVIWIDAFLLRDLPRLIERMRSSWEDTFLTLLFDQSVRNEAGLAFDQWFSCNSR